MGSRLTSNIKIILKITFTSEISADITRSLAVVLLHLKFCKKILILMFFSDLFSVECKFFCPNSADNTMENRAISLVESSRDNSLIACRTSSVLHLHFGGLRIALFVEYSLKLHVCGMGKHKKDKKDKKGNTTSTIDTIDTIVTIDTIGREVPKRAIDVIDVEVTEVIKDI